MHIYIELAWILSTGFGRNLFDQDNWFCIEYF
jgi:hypothetical protein